MASQNIHYRGYTSVEIGIRYSRVWKAKSQYVYLVSYVSHHLYQHKIIYLEETTNNAT